MPPLISPLQFCSADLAETATLCPPPTRRQEKPPETRCRYCFLLSLVLTERQESVYVCGRMYEFTCL